MALSASSKLRPKVVALQKRGVAAIFQLTEAAAANGSLPDKTARDDRLMHRHHRIKLTGESLRKPPPNSSVFKPELDQN